MSKRKLEESLSPPPPPSPQSLIRACLTRFFIRDLGHIIADYAAELEFSTFLYFIGGYGCRDGEMKAPSDMASNRNEVLVVDNSSGTAQSFCLFTGRFLRMTKRFRNAIPLHVHFFNHDMCMIEFESRSLGLFRDMQPTQLVDLPDVADNTHTAMNAVTVCVIAIPNRNSIVRMLVNRDRTIKLCRYSYDEKDNRLMHMNSENVDKSRQYVRICYDAQEDAILLTSVRFDVGEMRFCYQYLDPVSLKQLPLHGSTSYTPSSIAMACTAHGSDVLALMHNEEHRAGSRLLMVDKLAGAITKDSELSWKASKLIPVYNSREMLWQMLAFSGKDYSPRVFVME